MRNTILSALCSSLLLPGCAETQWTGHLLYMVPYKFEQFDCKELNEKANAATKEVRRVEQLREKANQSAAGPVINSVAYGPDYHKARWEQRLYQDQIARKNCAVSIPQAENEQ